MHIERMSYDTSKLLTYTQLQDEQLQRPIDPQHRDAKFQKQEYASRDKLHRLLTSNPNITEIRYPSPISWTYCPFDAFILSAGTEYFLELKERPIKSNRYPDSFVDDDKVKALLDLQNTEGVAVLFSSLFTDSKLLLWRVDQPSRIKTITCDRYTYRPWEGQVEKTMHYYDNAKAQTIQ